MAERALEWTTFEFQCWKYLVLGICTRIVALLLYIFQFPILIALICIVRGRTCTRANNIWLSVLKVSSTWDLHSYSSSATSHFPIPCIARSDLYRSWLNVDWTTFEFQCWKYLVLGICTRIVGLLLCIFQFPILIALICIVRGRTLVNNIWISVLKVSSTWDLHSYSSSATLHFPIPYIDSLWSVSFVAERALERTTFDFQCWKCLVLGICTRIVALLLYIFQFPILLALICIVRGRTWTRVNNIWISVLKVSSTWDLHSYSSSATSHFPIPYIARSDLYRSWPNVDSSEQHLNFSVESI